ncbi:pantoate--beta-alanine ligase [Neolewinella persica]|uniref:pantoate--beta-alanine ligase n=1 Tax=Neolewinella persica TaxID=70998 RepID=UPI0003711328|nr:pantoate--beta-alanine ligase [Neolewinella persica]
MRILKKATDLRKALPRKKSIAFVPTMGALHAGHMALIKAAADSHDLVVASIFVNPTQFNERSDLQKYPRTPKEDAALLKAHGCDFLYLPDVADVYPDGMKKNAAKNIDFGPLTATMEGANRPGHFDGVAQVVSRLLEIVEPDTLVLGQKDYQQVAVIRAMIQRLDLLVRVLVVPTVREFDGLAMSSRNKLLNTDERAAAAMINRQLAAVVAGLAAGWPTQPLEQMALSALGEHDLLDPEYVQIFDGDTLLPYLDGDNVRELVVATAVRCGDVRLIDNRIVDLPNP